MRPALVRIRRREIERLENTSPAVFGFQVEASGDPDPDQCPDQTTACTNEHTSGCTNGSSMCTGEATFGCPEAATACTGETSVCAETVCGPDGTVCTDTLCLGVTALCPVPGAECLENATGCAAFSV